MPLSIMIFKSRAILEWLTFQIQASQFRNIMSRDNWKHWCNNDPDLMFVSLFVPKMSATKLLSSHSTILLNVSNPFAEPLLAFFVYVGVLIQ
jgi:hypothetical protein